MIGNSKSQSGINREPELVETGYSRTLNSPGSCCLKLFRVRRFPALTG